MIRDLTKEKKQDVTSEFICWSVLKSLSITNAEDFRKGSRRDRFVLWVMQPPPGLKNNRFRLALLLLQKVKKPSRLLLNGDRKSDGWQPRTAVSAATSQRGLILPASCAQPKVLGTASLRHCQFAFARTRNQAGRYCWESVAPEPKLITLNELKYQSDNKTDACIFCFTLLSLPRFLYPLSLLIERALPRILVHLLIYPFNLVFNQSSLCFKRKSVNAVPGETLNFIRLNFCYSEKKSTASQ